MNERIFNLILFVIILFIYIAIFKIAFYIYLKYVYDKKLEDQRAKNSLAFAKKYNLSFDRSVPEEIQKREYIDSDITDSYHHFIFYKQLSFFYYCNYIYGDINNTSFIMNERVIYAPRTLKFQHIYIVKKSHYIIPNFICVDRVSLFFNLRKSNKISFPDDSAFTEKFTVKSSSDDYNDVKEIKKIFNPKVRELLVNTNFKSLNIVGSESGELKIVTTSLKQEDSVELVFDIISNMFEHQF